jgi:hypothetical protein
MLGLTSPTLRLNVKFSVGFMNSDWFKPGCGWNGVPSAFREPKGD